MAAFNPLSAPLSEVQQKLDKLSCPADVAELEYYLMKHPAKRDTLTRLVYCLAKTREIVDEILIYNHGFRSNPERTAVLNELKALKTVLKLKQKEGKGTVTLEKRVATMERKAEKLKYAPKAGGKLRSYHTYYEYFRQCLNRALKLGFTKKTLEAQFPEITYLRKQKL